ncbi:hypothetical protein QEH56_20260 [Pelagicoccus enzymogenes]|uniref:hypothetical protein n=1 Tax=Pelagicoccus enzymogenes TaxID=2773457 RepID=UPI0028108842|nr:hypothetical protein [Pelagicoccus enzymogenes]MDQ8200511.1 hypothetical protein [Pelagicoccus enzymogenes]
MRFTIYPQAPVLRLNFLVGYFLLSIQMFYVARPVFYSYAKETMLEGANYQNAADTMLGILWGGFCIFISFGFLLEILQKKGSKRMEGEVVTGSIEFKLTGLSIVVAFLGLLQLGASMFENDSLIPLLRESTRGVVLIAAGITSLSLISILRPKFRKKNRHIQSSHTTSASAPR